MVFRASGSKVIPQINAPSTYAQAGVILERTRKCRRYRYSLFSPSSIVRIYELVVLLTIVHLAKLGYRFSVHNMPPPFVISCLT